MSVCAFGSYRVLSNRIVKDHVVGNAALERVAFSTTQEVSTVVFMVKVGGLI